MDARYLEAAHLQNFFLSFSSTSPGSLVKIGVQTPELYTPPQEHPWKVTHRHLEAPNLLQSFPGLSSTFPTGLVKIKFYMSMLCTHTVIPGK